ncbi:MAG: hypothetical protein J0H74_15850 [Chitinophagaceae bacterium]|nr:hypothetical protein [Chitinophagaceae bacterium]
MSSFSDLIPGLTLKTYESGAHSIQSIEGVVQLPVWAGFQSRQGVYASVDSSIPSDGTVQLHLGSDAVVDNPTISPAQVAAYHYLIDRQAQVQDAILTSLLGQYKNLQVLYDYEPEEAQQFMPDVLDLSGFRTLIGLSSVHILEVSRDDVAYVGYGFGCIWDDEHGLGIMTHQDRIIEIGGIDTSFLTWVAKQDLDPNPTAEDMPALVSSPDSLPVVVQEPKKPWWKFW